MSPTDGSARVAKMRADIARMKKEIDKLSPSERNLARVVLKDLYDELCREEERGGQV